MGLNIWGHAKRYRRAHCDYTFNSLRKTVPVALDSIPPKTTFRDQETIIMFSYLEGSVIGLDMEKLVNKFGKEYKSYRRIGQND